MLPSHAPQIVPNCDGDYWKNETEHLEKNVESCETEREKPRKIKKKIWIFSMLKMIFFLKWSNSYLFVFLLFFLSCVSCICLFKFCVNPCKRSWVTTVWVKKAHRWWPCCLQILKKKFLLLGFTLLFSPLDLSVNVFSGGGRVDRTDNDILTIPMQTSRKRTKRIQFLMPKCLG